MGNCYMGVGLIVSVYPLRKLFTLFLSSLLKMIQHVVFAISLNSIYSKVAPDNNMCRVHYR